MAQRGHHPKEVDAAIKKLKDTKQQATMAALELIKMGGNYCRMVNNLVKGKCARQCSNSIATQTAIAQSQFCQS
jgi:hypothetical protein